MKSNWMDKQVSLYSTHSDNKGKPATYRDILFSAYKSDLKVIEALRGLDPVAPDYKLKSKPYKNRLQCFTPAALMATKAAGQTKELNRTGIMQMDFDYEGIKEYDMEELKECVFSLPFIAFCGLSCSGRGFYALALIAEPERLSEYAEHCFEVFKYYGIRPDESKGKKPENLRYVSYDKNMLVRENPQPLLIKRFMRKQHTPAVVTYGSGNTKTTKGQTLHDIEIKNLQTVQIGERWATVQKAAFTLGGLDNASYLDDIYEAINSNPAFEGEHGKYLKCAKNCFEAGHKQPLISSAESDFSEILCEEPDLLGPEYDPLLG